MQRRSFLFALLMAVVMTVLCPQAMRAAVETVTVGEGTSSDTYFPYGNYYKNSSTQMLYTASEIGKKGQIQSIAFYVSDADELNCSELKIYMGETDLTQLSTSSAFTSTGMQLVYSGTDVSIGSTTGWETMTLSIPFDYSGKKNLVVVVCRKSSSYTGNLRYRHSDGTSLYRLSDSYSDRGEIDNNSVYSLENNRANAQFQIKTSDHDMVHHEIVAPTATTAGNYEYWYCATHCQKYFKDEDGTEEYGDGEWIIPAGACPHQLTEHVAVPNNCTDDGSELYYECNICHHYFSDANAENEVEENSWVIAADPSMHVFTSKYDNGFGKCDVCGYVSYDVFEPAQYDAENNRYDIKRAGQLYWFADKVSNGDSSDEGYPFNARVTGTITVNSNVLTDEGELNGDGSNFLAWTPISNYHGTFVGYNCTIKGLYCASANSDAGLFSNNNGTITRISIEDCYFEGNNNVGSIVANNDGTVENCYSRVTVNGNANVGGIVGHNAENGVVQNCFSRATVTAATNDADRYGSVVGYNEGTLTNCYYLSDVADQQETAHPTVIGKTAEQFASGDVAWLLNGEKGDGSSSWGQSMGEGAESKWPLPRPCGYYIVWKGYMCFDDSLQYANHYLQAEPNHDHVYDNGVCKACGAYQTPESQTIDGVLTFDIANYGHALYVAKYTSDGNTCAARLVAPKVTFSNTFMTIGGGTLTLDLNGDTLTSNYSQVILVDGGNVTIHDSSANGTGALINSSAYAVYAKSGSLNITSGTFIGNSGYAVYTSSSCTSLAISGGKYYVNSSTSRFYTPGKSALAPGYAYYNMRTGEELTDYTTQPIYVAMSTDTVEIRQASVKAVLTKGGEDTNYYDFNSAFAAAQQCTADDNATLKLMKNYAVPNNGYITFSSGTFTLDLNGNTISNYQGQTILVNGANLTITDSSEGQNGALINSASFAVNVTYGSLTVLGGNFIARNSAPALNVGSPSPTVSLKGGKYISYSTNRVYASGNSLLAPDYSYYNLSTGEELNDVTSGNLTMSNTADTLIVKQSSVKAILTKGGEEINYYDFNSAFTAAQECTAEDNATLKLMKNRTMPSSEGYITLSSGTFTLDLNGDTIRNNNSYTLFVNGTNLTITDSSEGQKGALISASSYAVNVVSGSLTVLAGNLIARNTAPALYVGSPSPTVSLKGGKYMSNNTDGYRVYTYDKSLLAPGYSYYNLRTDEELNDVTSGWLAMSNTADTLIVKQGSVKAILTKGDEVTTYYSFNSAFAAAQQCTADDHATLKLMKNYAIPDGYNAYITFSSGTFTLDLNGDTISNNNSQTILVNGAELTITDSSEGKTGALINTSSYAVNVVSGSLTVLGGNFIARNTYQALNVGSSTPTVSLKGGKYMSNNTEGYRVYTYGKSLLAPGYSYYNLSTDEEMNDVTSGYISMSNTADTLIVKPGTVKAVLTRNGEGTNYSDFNAAFTAAQQCTATDNATLKLMKNYAIPDGYNAYITLSGGTFTLDLNGDTISNYNSQTILVSGANLTITDSSEGQNGALINSGSSAVNVTSGSLTVLAGNLIARNPAPALNVGSSSPTVSLKGGRYMSNNTYGSRIYTYGKSLLAQGYSYYNLSTDEEMNDVTSGYISMSNTADTLIVKPGTVKAVLTRNGEGTNYSDFNAAFTAAQQCKANEKATLKLMQNYAIPDNKSYITLSSGVFTLDLNGDTISIYNAQTILVSGANLTITDSSEGQKGALINRASSTVNVTDGSLTVLGGNIISRASASALFVDSSTPTVLLKGGKYMSNSTYGYRVKASGKSLLAPGYSYYNLRTGEEMTDVTDGILSVTNTADTVVVKQGAVKAMLTKGDVVTTYKDINAAFAAAQQCTASDNATLKLLQNVTLPNGDGYITLTDGAFTLDLNGDTLGIKGDWVLKLNGTDLTVIDSSEDQKGALVNTASIVVYAVSGSLTMESGNLKGKGQYSIYNNEGEMEITLLGGSYSGGMQYHDNSTLYLPDVAMFNAEGNEVAFNYVEYVDFNCYETEVPFTVNAYYTIGDVKNKLTKVDDGYYTEHLTLVDGKSFVSKYDFTAGEVEYSRAMTSKWGTLCLPFALTIDEANQPYSLYNVNGVEDGSLTVTKCTSSVEAGIPVIVRRDNAATGITITAENVEVDAAAHDNGYGDLPLNGTFEGEKINSGYYIANDKFWDAANYNGDVTIPPFRAYMTASTLCAKSIAIFDPEEEMTGVTTVTADETDPEAWYTLGGVKLDSKPVKAGTYVHGGKKVVVK